MRWYDYAKSSYEESGNFDLEAKDRGDQHCSWFPFLRGRLLRVPEVRVRSIKLACRRKSSACASVGADLESQFLRIVTFVYSLAVWARVESLEWTLGQWSCVPLRSDDIRGNVRAFRM